MCLFLVLNCVFPSIWERDWGVPCWLLHSPNTQCSSRGWTGQKPGARMSHMETWTRLLELPSRTHAGRKLAWGEGRSWTAHANTAMSCGHSIHYPNQHQFHPSVYFWAVSALLWIFLLFLVLPCFLEQDVSGLSCTFPTPILECVLSVSCLFSGRWWHWEIWVPDVLAFLYVIASGHLGPCSRGWEKIVNYSSWI